ncbi:hypothetical protein JB92DRAFT_3054363, partial [Gautieria morchelliformis]
MASRSVVGAEPTGAGADDAFRSSTIGGTFHPSVNPKTLADGLLTSTYELSCGCQLYTVTGEQIV